jgi:hypothetical protein
MPNDTCKVESGVCGDLWDALPFDDVAVLFLSITPLFTSKVPNNNGTYSPSNLDERQI